MRAARLASFFSRGKAKNVGLGVVAGDFLGSLGSLVRWIEEKSATRELRAM